MNIRILSLVGLLLVTAQAFAETTPMPGHAASRLAVAKSTYTMIASSLNPSTVGGKGADFTFAGEAPGGGGANELGGAGRLIVTVRSSTATPVCGTVYVTQSGAGSQDGSSWTNAFSGTALQTAINTAAGCGAQVWVAQGLYKPTTTTDRTISFSMQNGVAIYGGFGGGEATLNDRVLTYPSSSTLSGEIGDPTSTTDNSYHVIRNGPGLTNTGILDGFVITNGRGGIGDPNAGGMYNNGSGSGNVCSPTIRNALFINNYSRFVGGAMYNAGISGGTSSPVLINCSFVNNSAFNYGGAMYNEGNGGTSSPILTNCSFQGNITTNGGAGGGTYNFSNGTTAAPGNSSPVLTNCSFQSNSSSLAGAIYNSSLGTSTANTTLTNCVFFGNGGANTFLNGNSSTNTISATYSLFEPSSVAVTGLNVSGPGNLTNVTTNPFSSNASTTLSACSPAIDAGTNSAIGLVGITTDLAGNPRFYNGGIVDMGAYEFQVPFSVSIVATPSLTITVGQSATLTASGADSYTWSTTQTGASIVVSPTSTTAYSVTGLSGTCSAVSSATVTVSPAPPVITMQPVAPGMVCLGGSVTIPVGVTGATSFQWLKKTTPNDPNIAVGGQTSATLTLTNLQASDTGIYSLSVTGPGGSILSNGVTIQPISPPLAFIGASPSLTITQGQSTTLTASGAQSFLWSTGDTSPAISVSVAGPYSVTVSASGSGCFGTKTVTVTVTAPVCGTVGVTPSSSTLTCTNPTTVLTASGDDTYLWSTGATSSTLLASTAGTYSVTVTAANGCTATAGASVTENKTPPSAPALSGASRQVNTSTNPLSLTGFVVADAGNTLSFYGSSGLLNPPTANITTAGVQTFSAVQTNPAGCASPATVFSLTVTAPPTGITQPPLSQTVCKNSRVVLTVVVPGVTGYRWFETGQSAKSEMSDKPGEQLGTGTGSLTLVSVQSTSNYFCRVTLANGSIQW